jgi:hypothetical protein
VSVNIAGLILTRFYHGLKRNTERHGMNPHKSPQQTIRAYCHYCIQSRLVADVENCTGDIVHATGKPCPFYEYRVGQKRPSVKIMRRFCLECQGNNMAFVLECEMEDCLIHPYRMGKNPARTGRGASRERMIEISQNRMAVSR